MITFTVADITAARDNDLVATQLLMDAMLPVIDNIARKLASEVSRYGSDLSDDLAAEGRLALWRLIAEHDGNDHHGSGWLVKSTHVEMLDARRELSNPGSSEWEVNIFIQCLKKTDYDAAAALRMATSLPAGKRLSHAAAYAAQQALTPSLSLDAPLAAGDTFTVADVVAAGPYSAPDDDWNLGARIAAVHETLDSMPDASAQVVMGIHGHQENRSTIAYAMGFDSPDKVSGIKTRAERQFYTKFPWERVYPGPKPPLNPNRDSRTK